MEAEGPEPGYGWIAPGSPVEVWPGAELYAVRRFWEKPDRATAAHLFAAGYLWNTLVLAGRLETHLRLAQACVPEVVDVLRIVEDHLGTPNEVAALAQAYGRLRSTNLSRALLARRPEAMVVAAARGVSWSDWDDPNRIIRSLRRFDRRPAWLST